MTALEARDEQELLKLFAPDATWTADGGGRVGAAPHPIVGAERIAKLVLTRQDKFWAVDRTLEVATVNGEVGPRQARLIQSALAQHLRRIQS